MTELRSGLFDRSNMSAFRTLETAELHPVIQGDWVHGINTQIWQAGVTSGTGATVDTNAARLRIQSGTNSAGYAYQLSRRPIRYRAGQGLVARFTPIFTTGVADNIQFWGVGAVVSNAIYDGYGFMYNGASFGVGHYVRGAAVAFTAQASWNGGTLPFTYEPTKGTPVMIKYPYLGYGNIEFFIQVPDTGRWFLAHVIKYANTVATTQLSNPSMYFMGYTLNSGNTSNMTMYCGSVGIFLSGERSFVGNPKWAVDSSKSTITTETNLITIKNATTFNTITNRGLIRVNSISVSSSAANGGAIFRLKINATLGGSPSYTTVNGTTSDAGVTITSGNSIASYDTAGTTVSGGTFIYSISVDNPNSTMKDLIQESLIIAPGETLTVSGYSTNSATMGVSVNFSEDI